MTDDVNISVSATANGLVTLCIGETCVELQIDDTDRLVHVLQVAAGMASLNSPQKDTPNDTDHSRN